MEFWRLTVFVSAVICCEGKFRDTSHLSVTQCACWQFIAQQRGSKVEGVRTAIATITEATSFVEKDAVIKSAKVLCSALRTFCNVPLGWNPENREQWKFLFLRFVRLLNAASQKMLASIY